MPRSIPFLEIAPFAFFTALLLTPLTSRLARATGYVDHPASHKAHAESTPLLGGIAIALALVIAPLIAAAIGASALVAPSTGLVVGALIALAMVLIDGVPGFFVYNLPPARIFLGDAGSHLLGFALAALALQSLQGSFTLPHLAAIVLILAYPIFDATFVVWDRVVGHRPFYVGNTDHTTHRLGKLFGRWGTIGIVALAATVNALLGVWVWGRSDLLSILCVLCASALAYALFGTILRHISPTTRFVT